ncbi:unnamed protein product [Vicia faba]|uniref:Uncharacterized protein n=1 Tax=Vicia faba TaxID=3906 RepID=A0AAV0Z8E2_VICFA|nr:unnamed protein product [Vicia faba]
MFLANANGAQLEFEEYFQDLCTTGSVLASNSHPNPVSDKNFNNNQCNDQNPNSNQWNENQFSGGSLFNGGYRPSRGGLHNALKLGRALHPLVRINGQIDKFSGHLMPISGSPILINGLLAPVSGIPGDMYLPLMLPGLMQHLGQETHTFTHLTLLTIRNLRKVVDLEVNHNMPKIWRDYKRKREKALDAELAEA